MVCDGVFHMYMSCLPDMDLMHGLWNIENMGLFLGSWYRGDHSYPNHFSHDCVVPVHPCFCLAKQWCSETMNIRLTTFQSCDTSWECLYSRTFLDFKETLIPVQIHAVWNKSSWQDKTEITMQYLHWTDMQLDRHDTDTFFMYPTPYTTIIIPLKCSKIGSNISM